MTATERPLWQLVVARIRSAPHMSHPGSAPDRQWIRRLLWEMYMLGERPDPGEIAEWIGVDGQPTPYSREVAALWRERLRKPLRIVRGGAFAFPFCVPHDVVSQQGLTPIEARLAAQARAAATRYAVAVQADTNDTDLRQCDHELLLAATALRTWGQTIIALRTPHRAILGGVSLAQERHLTLVRALPPRG